VLRELHIKDFAIIEDVHLRFDAGFTILTGETGAGKSILIDAVELLLGERADTSAIRHGCKRARVEGLFILESAQQQRTKPILEREGLEGESPDALWLSRELRSSGRSVARVNGSVVSVTLMREIAQSLVDIHGQSEHVSLMRVTEHLNLLDRFANLGPLRAEVAAKVRELQSVRRALQDMRENERTRMQRIDLLRFQIDEIRATDPKPGEVQALTSEQVRLSNAEELVSLVAEVLAVLEEAQDEAPSALDLVGFAQRDMTSLARIDTTLTPLAETLDEVSYQLEDLSRSLRDYADEVEFNPQRLQRVSARLLRLRQLERKYGEDLEAVLTYVEQAEQELNELEGSDECIEELVEKEARLLAECTTLCERLSRRRQAVAATLATRVEAELEHLRMEGAHFGVAFQRRPDEDGLPLTASLPARVEVTSNASNNEVPTSEDETPVARAAFDITGMDRVEFLIAPNVGEGLKPMVHVASGGETARLMLALKTVLSRADQTPTLIFDEIDQGIGGRIGAVVGTKLWQLTERGDGDIDMDGAAGVEHRQVLCITHLPQLAGFGDTHFRVQKHIVEGRTITRVTRLERSERVVELGQMLGTRGEAAEQGALEILSQAEELKGKHVGP
jgi:DNA repair protein RecN (Recombination protein N)